jgi:hypothetical protein
VLNLNGPIKNFISELPSWRYKLEVVLKLWDSTTEKSLLVEVQEINRTLKTTKDIAIEKDVLPTDKHGNIRDVNGERMWHVFGTKRGRRLL